ncbi:PC4 and SFRS1-interacting protein [Bicyclus anynana]|uniref:PC4 and SFRS1-interacting protein n=1 Tax=Bicyclus anynana TaxID=110368 RepID=A0ABM3LVN6_BICAN|nr:PC4 and SFRS1-interacting protein [Bicyclus anynana]
MKMSKKVREYKAGDFIFAKVKGYPAWPARVQRMNGKKYFVYFYGTGETANLPPNMIFDYKENKDKFLTKTVKRRDFNDGVKQIEYDFANNVPLEQVIGVPAEVDEAANDTVNESTANETLDTTMADTTADETMAEENTTQNDTGIEDSDETGALVIDEGKQGKAAKKSTPKTPATPKAKEPKTPRGRNKKDEEIKEDPKEEEKKEEEIVSRSGRKIRPKRYIDEHTEDNASLTMSAPKKRRGASPVEKEKEKEKEKEVEKETKVKENKEKAIKQFNAVTQTELENLQEPFTPEDPEKENIVIAYLPSGQYIGVKLFQCRPNNFASEAARLQWDKRAASNALTLKSQLEKGHITPKSVQEQLVMDLNLTDEEKATLDKERDTEEKKSRVNYLKVEMKLIELDAKIKTCLCLEKANTELCLKLIDELIALDIKPLMLLKHPSTLETIKRMRAYVGNTPQWELTESDALLFSQHAHKIRQQADVAYNCLKGLFTIPQGLSFWEFFTERADQFKKATEKLTPDEVLEMVHLPLEMSDPTSHTMDAAIEAANQPITEEEEKEEEVKKTKTPAKTKKAVNNTTPKTPAKRQSSRSKPEEPKEKEQTNTEDSTEDKNAEQKQEEQNKDKESPESKENDTEEKEVAKEKKEKKNSRDNKIKEDNKSAKESKANKDETKNTKDAKTSKEDDKSTEKDSKQEESKDKEESEKDSEIKEKTPEKSDANTDDSKKDTPAEEDKSESSKEVPKDTEKDSKSTDKSDKEDKKKEDKGKVEEEPRAKRTRESKKTDPPRSPTKRKSKF